MGPVSSGYAAAALFCLAALTLRCGRRERRHRSWLAIECPGATGECPGVQSDAVDADSGSGSLDGTETEIAGRDGQDTYIARGRRTWASRVLAKWATEDGGALTQQQRADAE